MVVQPLAGPGARPWMIAVGRYSIALSAILAFQLSSAQAITFDWSYSGAGISGSGTLEAVDVGGGAFLVGAISGTANGLTITGLTTYAFSDEKLFSSSPQVDLAGLAFTVVGGHVFDIYSMSSTTGSYSCGAVGYCLMGPGTPGSSGIGDLTVPITFSASIASVPGPIAGAGLPGLVFASGGLLAWWRRRRST